MATPITVHGKPVEITQETILRTRQWYANNARACTREATAWKVRVNDLPEYLTSWRRGFGFLAVMRDCLI